MPKYSHYCFSLLASTLLLTSCGDDPVSTTDDTKAEGVACQNTNECKTGMSCYGNICRFNCQADDDCDIENYHCEDSVCLPGKATICGNGILELGEGCDDGGRTAGDGCDANCKLEQGWRCVSQAPIAPHSVCNRTQGNCLGNFTGNNCDECVGNFTGDNCDQCVGNFTGENCDQCAGNLTGDNCDQCKGNFTGTNCDQCADSRFTGTNCDQCADSRFTGDNCETCIDGSTGTEIFLNYTYKTICINGKFWMAENLRNQNVDHDSANKSATNDATYGYLYTWVNAMQACPEGWSLPTADDFLDLIEGTAFGSSVSTTAIQAKSWVSDATNSTGFSALPAGGRYGDGDFDDFGSLAGFWSSALSGSDDAYFLIVDSSGANVRSSGVDSAYSVRCLKDSN